MIFGIQKFVGVVWEFKNVQFSHVSRHFSHEIVFQKDNLWNLKLFYLNYLQCNIVIWINNKGKQGVKKPKGLAIAINEVAHIGDGVWC